MLAECRAPSPCRFLAALVVLVGACMLPATARSSHAWPAIHLRSATVPARHEGQGLPSSAQRRRLLQHDCHTEHAAWGVLHSAHQLLATQAPSLSHWERQEVVEHVEGAGARIMGYLPDDTLVLVGDPAALESAANHSHLVWAGPHEAAYKVAPEWETLLAQVDFIAAGLGVSSHSGGSGRSSSRGVGRAVNSTQVKQLQLAAALTQLPVRVAHRVGEWPRIGINVVYPAAFIPQPHAPDHPHAATHAARILRVRREQAETRAGSAAVADWAPILRDAFGGGVEVHSGGPHQAAVFAPADQLSAVVSWLAERPAVHWVAPMSRHRLHNRQASCISQSAKPAPASGNIDLDPSLHPLWAAGLTGTNQVIGIGDSGLDHNHCFFRDPTVDWAAAISVVNGVQQFDSTVHRKIRMYRAFADFVDANGHGTHTSGTLAGIPYATDLSSDSSINVGMAPDAKLAFIDLSSAADGDSIITPYDLMNDYFVYTTQVGAAIHSDSWGSSSITYDAECAQVDAYCWQNPAFLPVFPAGNDGGKLTVAGLGSDTVNSPATSKNCLAVGATESTQGTLEPGASKNYNTWIANAATAPSLTSTFPVLEAAFGPGVGTLGSASLALVAASPVQACQALQNSAPGISGALALIERGNCTFEAKALIAQTAGAAAVLIYDDQVGAYFVPEQDNATQATVSIPTMFIPRRIGQNLQAALSLGRAVNVTFSAAQPPAYGFENLASFSSQGPVGRDNRVKPDIVAPGLLTSAAADTTGQYASGGTCGYVTYGGTSMATPVVAASAALVKQYYEEGFYPSGAANPPDAFHPSGALLKATLVSGAAALQGYEEATGLPIDPPPSNRQGYGRVFLGQSLSLQGNPSSPKRLQVLDAVPINTGDSHQFCVSAGGGPLSVTLVWTDYPGSPAAAKSLVNDLDLTVRAAGLNGIPLLGNGGSIDDSTLPDTVNNIEQVALAAVPAGSVAIEVRGSSVQAASGPQPYALVVSGDYSGTLQNPTASSAGQCTVVVAVITSGPAAITNQSAPQFAFSTQTGSTQGVTFECRMADGSGAVGAAGTSDWQECASPATFSSLPDGQYTFSVRAQGETAAASQSFLKDTTPPQLSLAPAPSQLEPAAALPAAPPASTAQPSASFSFTAADATAVTFACQLAVSGGAAQQAPPQAGWLVAPQVPLGSWYNCTSPQTVAWLLPGQWTFSVQGTDAAGNVAQPAAFSWVVAFDPTKQYARVLSGPLLKVGKANVSFSLAALSAAGGSVAAVAGASTECAVAAGGASAAPSQWAACSSPAPYSAPTDGSYKFAARIAGDASASASPDPDTWAVSVFEVDTTPPTANITSGPPSGAAISTNAAAFQFSINEEGSAATCSLNTTATPSPCSSPAQFSNLIDGWYRFAVIPTDVVGNVGAPATSIFVIDTTPPNITDMQVPVALTTGAFNVTFAATDGAVGSGIKNVTCRVTPLAVTLLNSTNFSDPRWGWAPCASPWAVSGLVEGHWSVGVQAFDNANNPSGPTELEVWVDATPPVVNLTGAPPSDAVLAGGTVVFNISDGSTPLSAPPSVGSPVQWQSLLQSITADQYTAYRNGTATGASAPGSGGTAATQSIRADSSAAPGSPMSRAQVAQLQNAVRLGRGDVGSWVNCGAVCTYSGLGGGAYTFQARGTDAAGNSGPTSPPYAFEVAGAASSGLPTWALATIIGVGGVAVIVAVVSIVCCCRRRKRAAALARPTAGVIAAAHGGPYAAYPVAPTNGWGPPQYQPYPPQYTYAPNGSGMTYPPYSQHGVVNGATPYPPRLPPPALPQDPVEAQELALALAASEHETRRGREAAAAGAARVADEQQDAELRAAIEESLREQQRRTAVPPNVGAREEEDDALRAALEASLRDQARAQQQHGPTAPTMAMDWPPRE